MQILREHTHKTGTLARTRPFKIGEQISILQYSLNRGGVTMINTPKYPVSHEDRYLVCQEEVAGPLQMIIDLATTHGWGTLETITAMEEVLKSMRFAYAEDLYPEDDLTSGSAEDPDPSNGWPGVNP